MATEDDAVSAILSDINGSNEQTNELKDDDGLSGGEADEISSLLFQSQQVLSERDDELSQEDAAWVDSCLAFGSEELSDDSWKEIREALLDTLSSNSNTVEADEMNEDRSGLFEKINNADFIGDDEMQDKDESGDDEDTEENAAVVHDELLNVLPVDDGDAANSEDLLSTKEEEDIESRKNIFKVWDFESPDDEDELMKQLKTLVSETKLKLKPPASAAAAAAAATGDPVINIDLKDQHDIDELTAVMSDLSFRESKD